MTTLEGGLSTPPGRFALAAARFNGSVVDQLVAGAVDGLRRLGIDESRIDIVRVPGSFELPLAAHRLAMSKKYAAVICLGAVIRGETSHYDHVCAAATSGIARASLDSDVPVIFGVLTTDTLEQAQNRAGGKGGNKGFDAALAAVEMVNLLAKLP
jgi:6,7-dimethyl-8-ribityllumazine synthase